MACRTWQVFIDAEHKYPNTETEVGFHPRELLTPVVAPNPNRFIYNVNGMQIWYDFRFLTAFALKSGFVVRCEKG
jgi:hypothetical protein